MTATELETWMRTKIGDAMGVPPGSIDPDASFGDHGMDSVTAVRFTGELQDLLGRSLEATLLWEHPTIGKLARHLAP